MSKQSKFIIQDWASNTLQYNGKFNFGCYGQELGVPMEFESFEDAWEYIDMNIDSSEDVEAVELEVRK